MQSMLVALNAAVIRSMLTLAAQTFQRTDTAAVQYTACLITSKYVPSLEMLRDNVYADTM
jgi:hypothetical protein